MFNVAVVANFGVSFIRIGVNRRCLGWDVYWVAMSVKGEFGSAARKKTVGHMKPAVWVVWEIVRGQAVVASSGICRWLDWFSGAVRWSWWYCLAFICFRLSVQSEQRTVPGTAWLRQSAHRPLSLRLCRRRFSYSRLSFLRCSGLLGLPLLPVE